MRSTRRTVSDAIGLYPFKTLRPLQEPKPCVKMGYRTLSDASDGKYSNILFYFKNGSGKGISENLDFILSHFSSNSFPRTISTKTTEERQILVDNKDEALARFKQANYVDCRINAYSGGDIKGDPNFIFIDIDNTTNHKVIRKILNSKSS